jgi:transposase-like protein
MSEATQAPSRREAKRERVLHSAKEKAQAVLALWTERRRPREVCREMGIKPSVLSRWQERAMEGMLAALEPRRSSPQEPKPMLPAKVERLLARKSVQGPQTRLARRLAKLQSKPAEKLPPRLTAEGPAARPKP